MPVASGTKRKRGEGQWALGYREPLNKNEENKRNDDGLNVRQRIIDIYSKYGFDSIDPADLRGRFRWYGLYTQRRPGIDGGKTAVLEPEELDDRYFMLRVRIDGGQLSNDQPRVIGYVSRRYARGTADVTDRQNIQLHWIEIENVPDIWEALESVGLSTTEACGDTPRVILGCPLAGIDADEIVDGTSDIAAIGEKYIGDSAFSNLPRKFKTSISGCPAQCREVLEKEYLGYALPAGPAPDAPRDGIRDHVGVHRQRDGNYYVGFAPVVGRLSADTLDLIADLAARYGSGRVHTTTEQKMVILDVPPERTEDLVAELDKAGLPARPSAFRRHTMACTGIEFCKLAIVETKTRAADLISELERRLPGFDAPVTINVNGCPNSCARIQTADIGLKGSLVTGPDGQQVEGFQVHLGGSLSGGDGSGSGFGPTGGGGKTTAEGTPDYVERGLRPFDAARGPRESLAAWT